MCFLELQHVRMYIHMVQIENCCNYLLCVVLENMNHSGLLKGVKR